MARIIVFSPQEGARNGARLLDRILPGWFNLVDSSTLHTNSGWDCVLGQINSNVPRSCSCGSEWCEVSRVTYANCEEALAEYFGGEQRGGDLVAGRFMRRNGFFLDGFIAFWSELDDAWRHELSLRQAA